MSFITATLQLSLKGIAAAKVAIANPSPKLRAELTTIYDAFIAARFDKLSAGGGGWRPLKAATIRAKGSSAILVDSREMRKNLSIQLTFDKKMTARFKSKKRHKRAKMPMAALLTIHDKGLGNVPQRRILVQPDLLTAKKMAAARIRAVKKAMKK